jgi:hypothetical protein
MACQATTKAGEPCRATEYRGGWCYHHHPDLEEERRAAKRKGGLVLHHGSADRDRPEVRLKEVRDVLGLLEVAAADAMERKPGIQRARALVYISTAALRALETADLAERVAALEARLTMRESA